MQSEQDRQGALAVARDKDLDVVAIMTHYAVEDRNEVLRELDDFMQQSNWLIQEVGWIVASSHYILPTLLPLLMSLRRAWIWLDLTVLSLVIPLLQELSTSA